MRISATGALTNRASNEVDVISWKAAVGFPGYEISSDGQARSIDRTIETQQGPKRRKGQAIKPQPNHQRGGYLYVNLGGHTRRLNVAVLETFWGERPEGADGCHSDGDVLNNTTHNLRWDSKKANAQDTLRHGRNHSKNKTTCPYAHELVEPNLRPRVLKMQNGGRGCLACSRARAVMQRGRRTGTDHLLDFQAIADQYYRAIMGLPERKVTVIPAVDPDLIRAELGDLFDLDVEYHRVFAKV